MSHQRIDEAIGGAVPWSVAGVEFPVWQTVRSNQPPTAVDGTETLATPIDDWERVAATTEGESLSRTAAIDRVIGLGRRMLAGKLPTDRARPVDSEAFTRPPQPSLLRKHSYTSLSALETCPRKHYLDYVVRAPNLQRSVGGDGSATHGGIDARTVGILFHDTAEAAARRGEPTPADWKQIGQQLATARGETDALPLVEAAIDRYFETEAAAWPVEQAERAFDIDIAGSRVVGMIDAVCRTPDGSLAILDYKVTTHRRDLETDLQLPIYLLAAERLFDEPIAQAGFVYVGEAGPALETTSFSPSELLAARDRICDRLDQAEASDFSEYRTGDHCYWCSHQDLSCFPHD